MKSPTLLGISLLAISACAPSTTATASRCGPRGSADRLSDGLASQHDDCL